MAIKKIPSSLYAIQIKKFLVDIDLANDCNLSAKFFIFSSNPFCSLETRTSRIFLNNLR